MYTNITIPKDYTYKEFQPVNQKDLFKYLIHRFNISMDEALMLEFQAYRDMRVNNTKQHKSHYIAGYIKNNIKIYNQIPDKDKGSFVDFYVALRYILLENRMHHSYVTYYTLIMINKVMDNLGKIEGLLAEAKKKLEAGDD